MHQQTSGGLLGPGDPEPHDVVNGDSRSGLLLVCEHAGREIPRALNGLGLSKEAFDEHVTWDIGAADVARGIAEQLAAPAVLQPYSRLVIDCNRPPDAPDAVPTISHAHPVPGNVRLSAREREDRVTEVFWPFQNKVDTLFSRHTRTLALSIHSYTPVLNGIARQWDIGLLHRADKTTAPRLKAKLENRNPGVKVALNQPYIISDASDWFVPRHGEPRGVSHVLVEIRNDLISTVSDADHWARRLSDCISELIVQDAS